MDYRPVKDFCYIAFNSSMGSNINTNRVYTARKIWSKTEKRTPKKFGL